jgi:hypothetical protein
VISFRYHVVSIVAVFLALALGVVVGTTALNGPITTDLRNKVDSLNKQRAADLATQDQLQQQVNIGNQFAGTYAGNIVDGTLTGAQVIMISMPNASSTVADGVAKQIAAAGATVSGRLQLTSAYTDPKRASDLLSLAKQVQPIGLQYPATQDAGTLGGKLLSYVLSGQGQQSDISTTLAALSAAQMLKVVGSDSVRPTKMIVVIGTGSLAVNDAGGLTQLQLVTQLQLAGCHTLVAGDNISSKASGLVYLVRTSDADKATVSTVDDADTTIGQVTAVLALADLETGKSAAYGTGAGVQSVFPSATR